MSAFDTSGANQPMNKGTYGFPLPPNAQTRVAPPEWKNYQMILSTTSGLIVPQNVYQMKFLVWGASSAASVGGGGTSSTGGGYAEAIVDVTPGQILPTVTVAATAGATSSVGAWLSATGGTASAGTGTVSSGLRGAYTASGGAYGVGSNVGGAASGSPYGNGGDGSTTGSNDGGSAWGGVKATTTNGATTPSSLATSAIDGIFAVINRRGLPGRGATSATDVPGIGCGAFGQSSAGTCIPSILGGGGSGGSTSSCNGSLGGGGPGNSAGTPGAFGKGLVIIAYTEGY